MAQRRDKRAKKRTARTRGRARSDDRASLQPPEITVTINSVEMFLPPEDLPANLDLAAAQKGIRVEDEVRRRAAARFSSAFVFRVPDVMKLGSGSREIGDGLIVIGPKAIVLQVKARDVAATDSETRATSWIEKKSAEALRQVAGTVKSVRQLKAPILLEMVEADPRLTTVQLPLDPRVVTEFVGVVVIDHDSDEAPVHPLDLRRVDFPVVRMRLDEWHYIVSNCDSATELFGHLVEHAGQDGTYRGQRSAFALSPTGSKLQPFPVSPDRQASLSNLGDPGSLWMEVPRPALLDPGERAQDQQFRQRLFGCLLHEVDAGADVARVQAALAQLDTMSAEDRRGQQEQWVAEIHRQDAVAEEVTRLQAFWGGVRLDEYVFRSSTGITALVNECLEAEAEAMAGNGTHTLVVTVSTIESGTVYLHGYVFDARGDSPSL